MQKIPFSICRLAQTTKLQGPLGSLSEGKHDWVGRARYRCSVVTKVHERDAHATSECPNFSPLAKSQWQYGKQGRLNQTIPRLTANIPNRAEHYVGTQHILAP